MTTTDTIPIELNQAERHTLIHLLNHYVRQRAWETIRAARRASDIYEGAEAARLLAELHGLTEDDGSLPVADLDAHRANLVLWAEETEATVDEHEESLVKADEGRSTFRTPSGKVIVGGGDHREIEETIDHERELIVIDYAHRSVCEKIVSQIDAARELVPA
jgi:hypothetical protein